MPSATNLILARNHRILLIISLLHTHFIIDSSAGDQTLVSLWFGEDFLTSFPMATWYDRTHTNPWRIARMGIAVVYSMVSFW